MKKSVKGKHRVLRFLLYTVSVLVCAAAVALLLRRYSANSEAEAYLGSEGWSEPFEVHDGLAVYSRGGQDAPVLLLFPYPHAGTSSPMIDTALAELYEYLGFRVLSFDPPGAYRSTRPARVDMPEMLSCAVEALETAGIGGPVVAAGHSMGSFCALAFAVEHPERVRSLILEGSLSGFPSSNRHGLPGEWLTPKDEGYRLFVFGGMRIAWGFADLGLMKEFLDFYESLLVIDPARRTEFPLDPNAAGLPVPVRARWTLNMFRGLDYSRRLSEVAAPTLIVVGELDRQTPPACSEELDAGIPSSHLVVVPGTGHSPHIEDPQAVGEAVAAFTAETAPR